MGKVEATEAHPFSLRSVYLREGKQWMAETFDPMIPGQPVFGQFKSSGQRIEIRQVTETTGDVSTIKSCIVITDFQFRYLNREVDDQDDPEDRKYLVAEICASIAVDYLINAPEVPEQKTLEEWAAGNALIHCWPYWREYCHSIFSRMNLPVVLMPLIAARQRPE